LEQRRRLALGHLATADDQYITTFQVGEQRIKIHCVFSVKAGWACRSGSALPNPTRRSCAWLRRVRQSRSRPTGATSPPPTTSTSRLFTPANKGYKLILSYLPTP